MKRTIFTVAATAILSTAAAAQGSGSNRNAGLTHDQVHELQQALKEDGCYNGRVDGQIGPKTRAAIACSRRKHDLEGNNANELFRALNVNFTIDDSTGMGGIMRSGNRRPERRSNRSIEPASNRGRSDQARDSAAAHEDHDRTARGDTASGMENKGKKSERGKKPVKP